MLEMSANIDHFPHIRHAPGLPWGTDSYRRLARSVGLGNQVFGQSGIAPRGRTQRPPRTSSAESSLKRATSNMSPLCAGSMNFALPSFKPKFCPWTQKQITG